MQTAPDTTTTPAPAPTVTPRVPSALGDIFFNTCHKDAEHRSDRGEFLAYHDDVLLRQATDLLTALEALGLSYSQLGPRDLVEDFLQRT